MQQQSLRRRYSRSAACWLIWTAAIVLTFPRLWAQTPIETAAASSQQHRFADQIKEYLDGDTLHPPPAGGILFIGSSIFRRWTDLGSHMAPLPAFNRAFGGSRTDEVLYYMDRIVLPCKPKIIVYYCGSNDVNAGVAAEVIFANFKKFTEGVDDKLPGTRIFFVSIIRAPQKKDRWNLVDQANSMVQAFCANSKRVAYIDINPAVFDNNGNPLTNLYLDDMLHYRPDAYLEFTRIIKPILESAWSRP
jgi:hypothetical protein